MYGSAQQKTASINRLRRIITKAKKGLREADSLKGLVRAGGKTELDGFIVNKLKGKEVSVDRLPLQYRGASVRAYEAGPNKKLIAVHEGSPFAAHYDPRNDIINVSKDSDVSVLLHELGHGTGTGGKLLRESPAYGLSTAMGQMGIGGAIATGVGAHQAQKQSVRAKDEEALQEAKKTVALSAATGAAIQAPLLFEEARATIRARGFGKKFGVQNFNNKLLAKAYGTYLTGGLAPIAAGAGIGAAIVNKRAKALKKKKREKTAAWRTHEADQATAAAFVNFISE